MEGQRQEPERDVLLVALTVSAGAVDAISWLAFGKVFSAFMTGNMVLLGFGIAGAPGPPVLRAAASLAGFGLGAALGGRLVFPAEPGVTWPRRVTLTLALAVIVETVFFGLWLGVDAQPSARAANWLIAVLALAMGIQTAAVFSLGVRAVFTTAATATWAALMGDVVHWSGSAGERRRLASVLVGLLAGAVAGGLLMTHAATWAPVLPLAVTATVVAIAAKRRQAALSP